MKGFKLPQLKEFAKQTNEMAKSNLITHGYLEKVALTFTDKGFSANGLQWTTDESKRKTISHFLAKMKEDVCHLYVMVGEATIREISPRGEVQRDCILITGETRSGERLVAMTPIIKTGGAVKFAETNWMDTVGAESHFNLLRGIFDK